MAQVFGYEGKRVVVTGAASGIGEDTVKLLADLGAEVYGLDIKEAGGPLAKSFVCDVGDPAAIEATIGVLDGPIHALFNIAGIAGTAPPFKVMDVNFLGLRLLTERALPLMPTGSAIVSVASIAANGWPDHVDALQELISTEDFDTGQEWVRTHDDVFGEDAYPFSKECVIYYTMSQCHALVERGIRINAVSPGPVDSPLFPEFRKETGDKVMDRIIELGRGRPGEPKEIAPALVFLNSDAASYVTGANLPVDGGFTGHNVTRRRSRS